MAKNVKGSLFSSIIITTIIGIPMGGTFIPDSWLPISAPQDISPIFCKFDFSGLISLKTLLVIFSLLLINIFDTIGTLVGVSTKAGLVDENGNLPHVKKALFADAIGTTFGALLGTSTVTTYVESASGVAEGGRTGLTALTTGVLFLVALLLSPIFLMSPSAATAPALITVGLFMMSPIKEIDLDDFTEAVPAFLTILLMPLAYSIAQGIVFGIISYALLKLLTGRYKEASPILYILAFLFILKIAFHV